MFSLSDKAVLVTGGGSGIGACIARAVAAAGARVIVTDKDASTGESTAAGIRAAGAHAGFFELDVADEAACVRVARQVEEREPRLDVLVNNAGIGFVGALPQTRGEDLDRLWAVNVRGMFNLTRALLPGMLERRRGNIINMASIGGVVAVRDRLAYCTTKFAVVGMTKCLALDHAQQGIRANCICPGRVETPFVSAMLKQYPDPEKAYREMASTQALGRMATPEEIAAAAVYLASDESAFVTGTAFIIDGGWTAGR
jgi:NAD(P)-dependent dehydrogenase (short-subunit alcohol dehydrogenase family)